MGNSDIEWEMRKLCKWWNEYVDKDNPNEFSMKIESLLNSYYGEEEISSEEIDRRFNEIIKDQGIFEVGDGE